MTAQSSFIKSPALTATLLSSIAGIIVALWFEEWKPASWIFLSMLLAGLGGYPIAFFYSRRRLLSLASLISFCCILLVSFGLSAVRIDSGTGSFYLPPLDGEVILTGEITSFPDSSDFGTRFILRAHAYYYDGAWTPFSERIQISIPHTRLNLAKYTIVRGTLSRPRFRRNPAGFDEQKYLSAKRVHFRMRADSLLQAGSARSPIPHLIQHIQSWRKSIASTIDRLATTNEARAILKALIVGDRSAIETDTLDNFRTTGLLHVLAVSGLHVLLVGLTVYRLMRPMLARLRLNWRSAEWTRVILTLTVLLVYMLIAGARASVVRAVLMAAMGLTVTLVQRPFFPFHALCVAALALLSIHPQYLIDIGFQLSFSALAAILLLFPRMKNFLPASFYRSKVTLTVSDSCLVSLAATLGTMPVTLYHFGSVSFAGLLLNLVAIPITTAALCAGLTMLVAFIFSPTIAGLFGQAASTLIQLLIFTAREGASYLDVFWFQSVPFSPLVLVLGLIFFYVLLLVRRHRWKYFAILGLTLAIYTGRTAFSVSHRPSVEMIFFDVGHGDACLIRLPNGRTMLIDAGNRTRYADPASRILIPFLQRYRIDTLDAVLITHPHADHYGGLASLLDHVKIRRLLQNGSAPDESPFTRLLEKASADGTTVDTLVAGDTLTLDPTVKLRVLSPDRYLVDSASPNDASLVLHIEFGNMSFLFLGDAEDRAEEQMVNRFGRLLRADVVKVAHHGSQTSSTNALLDATSNSSIQPVKWAVVSTGNPSVYGLPDEEVMDAWGVAAAKVHVTADLGALWLVSDGAEVWEKGW